MIDNELLEILMDLDFSEKEVEVYLSLFELGSTTASRISRESGIKRSTVYVVLDSLAKKGLVATTKKENSPTLYSAASPQELVNSGERLANKYASASDKLKEKLGELMAVYNKGADRPVIQYFEGERGVIAAYEDTLTSSETILAFAPVDYLHGELPNYFPEYYSRRAANNIRIRSIHPDTEETRLLMERNEMEDRDGLLVPPEYLPFSSEINIYDNKVAFMSLVEKYSIIIKSEEFSKTLKQIFELSWIEAKRLDREIKESSRNS